MNRHRHETAQSERLAMWWHVGWLACSLGSLVFALGGIYWHARGVQEHKRAYEDLR